MAVINIVEYDSGNVEVWADVPGADMEGIIVGIGASRAEAVADAVHTLEALTEQLQQPPSVWTSDEKKYYKRDQTAIGCIRSEFRIFSHESGVDL